MTKRAAIYVRVSSEVQADKISPFAQEQDARALCQTRNYVVIETYKDIEKYRVGNRLVEPSGTRADRPQLRRMIADADAGKFDVIIAWREDRLYRSYRPMLDVLECIERNAIDIELAKETFDRNIAPVKAWAAKMELDAKHDRQSMGIAGRLAAGKVWPRCVPFGYSIVGTRAEPDPVTAQWVAKVWEWYAGGWGRHKIRQQLILANVPQKNRRPDAKGAPWKLSSVMRILRTECYYTGAQVIKWGGRVFEIPMPQLVSSELARRVLERRAKNKRHPARNLRFNYLAMGLIHCGHCGCRMNASARKKSEQRGDHYYAYYVSRYGCNNYNHGYTHDPACGRIIDSNPVDIELWRRVWAIISNDSLFSELIEARVDKLRTEATNTEAEIEGLTRQLDELKIERQRVNTHWRKGKMTDEDYDLQIAALTDEESGLQRNLEEKSLLVGDRAEKLMEFADVLRQRLRAGADFVNTEISSPETAQKQFEVRRGIVEEIVQRVDLLADKTIRVKFVFDLGEARHIKTTPLPQPAP